MAERKMVPVNSCLEFKSADCFAVINATSLMLLLPVALKRKRDTYSRNYTQSKRMTGCSLEMRFRKLQ